MQVMQVIASIEAVKTFQTQLKYITGADIRWVFVDIVGEQSEEILIGNQSGSFQGCALFPLNHDGFWHPVEKNGWSVDSMDLRLPKDYLRSLPDQSEIKYDHHPIWTGQNFIKETILKSFIFV